MLGVVLVFYLSLHFLAVDSISNYSNGTEPEQIHLAATETPSSMLVSWVTFASTSKSIVKYGLKGKSLTSAASGNMTRFEDHSVVRYMHVVEVKGLRPGEAYDYQCGYGSDWSKVFTMYVLKDGTDWSPRFVIYGDLGYQNGDRSIPLLTNQTNDRQWDVVLHVGDMAYDLFDNGDDFMNAMQDVASQVPYMVCPGNHEYQHNFTHYRNRFNMPGDRDSYYYSWDVGPAHIISFSTELYFFLQFGMDLYKWQYEWLENDLKLATSPEQRAKHPWIITMGHRPMYCASSDDNDDCTHVDGIIRYMSGLEKLFYDYGVDVELSAHEHNYERLWPVYDRKVYNGSYDAPYVNPKAPVHFITGEPGNREGHDIIKDPLDPWFAKVDSVQYGYSRMTVFNTTHLFWEQISATAGGSVIDSVMIVKDKHGPEAWL